MVKRGIGAVVLAIIAALLLGYLLKDKSRERQEVVDMKLPGTAEMKIPSLTDVKDSMTNAVAKVTNNTPGNTANEADNTPATNKSMSEKPSLVTQKDTQSSLVNSAATPGTNTKPGFAIRPPEANEQRAVVDTLNQKSGSTAAQHDTTQANKANNEQTGSLNKVVASSTSTINKPAEKFKPMLVEEKQKPRSVIVTAPKKSAPVKNKPAVTSPAASTGKYSIQLLATSSQSRAKKLAKTMQNEGYQSFITQTSRNNKILYRVRIGAHNNRNAALKAQQNLKRRYQKNFFVQNSLVVTN